MKYFNLDWECFESVSGRRPPCFIQRVFTSWVTRVRDLHCWNTDEWVPIWNLDSLAIERYAAVASLYAVAYRKATVVHIVSTKLSIVVYTLVKNKVHKENRTLSKKRVINSNYGPVKGLDIGLMMLKERRLGMVLSF